MDHSGKHLFTVHPCMFNSGCFLTAEGFLWFYLLILLQRVKFVCVREREIWRRNAEGSEWKLQCARTLVADTQTASLKCLHRHSQLHTFSVSCAPNCPKFGRNVRRLAWMAFALFFFFWQIHLTGERAWISPSESGTLPWISVLASFQVLSSAQRGQE